MLTSNGSWKQWHVPSLPPLRRYGQAALRTAPSTGTVPAAPIGAHRSYSGAERCGATPLTGAGLSHVVQLTGQLKRACGLDLASGL